MNKIEKAIEFAMKAHEGQVRKDSGLPYIIHPLSVARVLGNICVPSEEEIIAAILHDVVEDTMHTLGEITLYFGVNISSIVEELTRPPHIKNVEDKTAYLKRFAEKVSDEAIMIKTADRYCNVEDFFYYRPDNTKEYALQAKPVFKRAITLGTNIDKMLNHLEKLIGLRKGQLYKGR